MSTQNSVLIIGGDSGYPEGDHIGLRTLSSIVEYKDDHWNTIGELKESRGDHNAISIGSLFIIIGGTRAIFSDE